MKALYIPVGILILCAIWTGLTARNNLVKKKLKVNTDKWEEVD